MLTQEKFEQIKSKLPHCKCEALCVGENSPTVYIKDKCEWCANTWRRFGVNAYISAVWWEAALKDAVT